MITAECSIYNWKELNDKYELKAKDEKEFLQKIIEKKGTDKIKETLQELDGAYAFAYQTEKEIILCRDIIGEKPIFYNDENGLSFAFEKKMLKGIRKFELNPRTILKYNKETKKTEFIKKEFFEPKETKDNKETIKKKTLELIKKAIQKRLPKEKFGILFSGGIDSTIISFLCKKLGCEFTCYTAGIEEKGMEKAKDLEQAETVAKELGFELKIKTINLEETEQKIKKIIPILEDANIMRVGVALPLFIGCEMAKKDGIKIIFSGLGSEEIFAGYERHKKSQDINKECVSGLLNMYERDLYRDYMTTKSNELELRAPLLDTELVKYALKIPSKYKINGEETKTILRETAEEMGVPEEFTKFKKRAAQYGSKSDKAIEKLAKKQGKRKPEYLMQFYPEKNVRLGALMSSGKDSMYAMQIMKKQNYPITCLITIKSKNKDSYMFHTPNIDLVEMQSEALEIPLIIGTTTGEKEKELTDLKKILEEAKKKYKIQGIITGALFSNYQRERIEKIADSLELKVFSPLWHMDQETLLRQLIDEEYEFILSSIAAYGLNKKWLGRKITNEDIDKLVEINKKIGINIAFEGGEAESLVLDCPMFKKKIKIMEFEIIEESEEVARYVVKKAELVEK
jgi:asparagine synthase (glutamine-hydrolysing)